MTSNRVGENLMYRFFTRLLAALLLATAAVADTLPSQSTGSGDSEFTPVVRVNGPGTVRERDTMA